MTPSLASCASLVRATLDGRFRAMRTTIDRAGRVVVPKAIRERLRLDDGGLVEVTERDGVIEIVPVGVPVDIVETPEGPVAVPNEPVQALTDDVVFDTIDTVRT